MTREKTDLQSEPAQSADDILRRMLNTPPKPKAVKKKAPKPKQK